MNKLYQFLYNRAISTDECKMKKMYLICFGIIITLTTLGNTTFWMPPRIPLRIIMPKHIKYILLIFGYMMKKKNI